MTHPTQRLQHFKIRVCFKEKNIVFYSEVRRFENWMDYIKNKYVGNQDERRREK
jgi:hypothetical protein